MAPLFDEEPPLPSRSEGEGEDEGEGEPEQMDDLESEEIDDAEIRRLDEEMDRINSVLDQLERKNDAIHDQLRELLEFSRQTRQMMVEQNGDHSNPPAQT